MNNVTKKREKRMRKVGLTTVQRWLSEKVDWGVKSYMESGGKLYELSTITGANGGIAVTLVAEFKLHAATFFAGYGNYTLQSPVYLYAGKDDLTGLAIDGVELTKLGLTPASRGSEWVGGNRYHVEGPQQEGSECGNMPREGSLSMPCHPHCG
jgi:hypothetical protein